MRGARQGWTPLGYAGSVPDSPALASLPVRFLAKCIDWGFVVAALGAPFGLVVAAAVVHGDPDRAPELYQTLTGLSVLVLVAGTATLQWMTLSTFGQTVGKWLCGVRIVRDDGAAVGFLEAVWSREILTGLILGFLACFVGPLARLVDWAFALKPDRKALHDRIANTKVIRTRPPLERSTARADRAGGG